MKNSDEIVNELKQIAPKLTELEKNNGFEVTDEYFIDLGRSIYSQTINSKNYRIFSFNYRSVKVAAAALILLFSGFGLYQVFFNKNTEYKIEQSMEKYVLSYYSSSELIDFIGNTAMTDVSSSYEDYYLENIDENALIKEL